MLIKAVSPKRAQNKNKAMIINKLLHAFKPIQKVSLPL